MELGRERFAVGFKRERGRQRALLTQRAPQRLGKGHQLLRAADLRLEGSGRLLPCALHAGLGRIPHEEVIQRSGGQHQHNDREQDPEPDPLLRFFGGSGGRASPGMTGISGAGSGISGVTAGSGIAGSVSGGSSGLPQAVQKRTSSTSGAPQL